MQNNLFLNRILPFQLVFVIAITILFYPVGSVAGKQVAGKSISNLPALLVLGDSLSASFGIEKSQGWVSLLTQKLEHHQYRMKVINASISGETTQGGLQRLPSLLAKHNPAVVIVELGGNDGLRGLKLSMIESNLGEIVKLIKNENASIVLAGIRLPPNYGQIYTEKFYQIYRKLAKQQNIALVPFIMEGVATDSNLMQADGIHPTAEAQPVLLKNVWEILQPMLTKYLATTTNP